MRKVEARGEGRAEETETDRERCYKAGLSELSRDHFFVDVTSRSGFESGNQMVVTSNGES